MSRKQPKTFKLNRMAVAVMLATASPAAINLAHAGAGWGDSTLASGVNVKRPTYFAHSPSGPYPAAACFDAIGNAAPAGSTQCDSGTALRKFVDVLPNIGLPGGTGAYISVAAPDTTTYPGSHYYELVVMESVIQMHSDLPATGTRLRTYVQVDPIATDSAGASRSAGVSYLGLPFASQAIALVNSDGSPVMISRPNGAGGFVQRQAYGWDKPTYLGSTIVAQHGTPTRVKFYNGLPAGHGGEFTNVVNPDGSVTSTATPGVFHRNGDLLIPVDRSNPGAGDGPLGLGTTTDVLASNAVMGPYDPADPTKYFIDPAVPPVARADYVQHVQNRAEFHLHGGDNPWQSDGHPHQWIAPAADELNTSVPPEYRRGPIAYNVPDMPDPGPGAVTYFWPNGQSGRLMMFHDHATGITRLNAYMGEAAGYVLVDDTELALITSTLTQTNGTAGILDIAGIPLVIQDKTFVPKNILQQDARWDTTHWGNYGDLWYPHVYEPNQDPESVDGTNPVGRWDWGSFFWPVFPSVYAMPTGVYGDETLTPEAWMDTPTVNGMAYPTLTVDPKTYRFRILAVANDRGFNLGLYVAADKGTTNPNTALNTTATLCDGSNALTTADCTEIKTVAFTSPNSPLTTTYVCPDGVSPGQTVGAVNANGTVVKAGWTETSTAYPVSFPCAGGLNGTGWGQADNRPSGVPDPTTLGPDMVMIGNEGGLLAQPSVIPSTPINYEYNKRSVTVLNVLERGLWVTSAERADVLIDFSQYAGKTLIMYNDSPAPIPAGDPRLDFYTGMGDMTGAGGAPNPLPGYGPNTRTVMQIKVNAATPGTALNTATLATGLGAAYAATQPKPVVPESQFNNAFNLGWTDTLARIYTGAIYLNKYNGLTFTPADPIAYTKSPVCSNLATCNTALAAIRNVQDPALPATMKGLTKATVGTPITAYVENKAIQELFEPDYGRMNATLGVELPFSSATIQTTIPLAYVDPATETIKDGETQFWKITHNGVDTHPVHFHMLNVQVLNRVGWDGTLKPPLANEWGWKETVSMHPLEDIVVAVRAKTNPMPFGLPFSSRLDAPHLQVGDNHGFTQIDPITGNPAVQVNKLENYKYEYVWHCHILGHEENDFMRPFVLDPGVTLSNAPTGLSATPSGNNVVVNWTDATPVVAPAAGQTYNQVNAGIMEGLTVNRNEIGFRVERSDNGGISWTALGTPKSANSITNATNTLANATSFTDTGVPAAVVPATPVLATPTSTSTSVALTWTGGANTASFSILRDGSPIASVSGTTFTYTDSTVVAGTSYSYQVVAVGSGSQLLYRVAAVNAAGDALSNTATAVAGAANAPSNTVSVTTPGGVSLLAPTNFSAQLAALVAGPNDQVLLNWTDTSTGETGYRVQRCSVGACGATSTNWATVATLPANTATTTLTAALNNGTNYRYRVAALNGATVGPVSATVSVNLNVNPAAPTGLAGTSGAAGAPLTVGLTWTDNSNNNASFQIQRCTGASVAVCGPGAAWTNVSTTVGANATTFVATLPAATTFRFRIRAVNPNGNSAYNYTTNVIAAQ